MNQQRFSEAEEIVRAALRTRSDAGILWKILSVSLVRQNKKALPELRRAVELLPCDVEAISNLGSALHEQREWSAALTHLRRVLTVAPDDADVLIETADCLRGVGRAHDAVALYERALLSEPSSALAHNNLGNALLELGDYARAIQCYQRAVETKPHDAQILCNLSNGLRQAGRIDEALTAGRQATALAPRLGAAHRELGLALAALGQRTIGLQSLRDAVQLNPADAGILNGLGNVIREMGDPRQALVHYLGALELEPGRPEHYCNLGNALFEARQVDEAVLRYNEALALRCDYAPAHLGLAFAYRQQRRPVDAQNSCRAALRGDPTLAGALSFLGELEADEGRFEEAEKLFRQALRIKPDFVFAIVGLATHCRMTGDDADGLNLIQTSLAKPVSVGEEISLRFALGKYFDDSRQYDHAFSEYARANELTKRRGSRYEPTNTTRRIDQIIDSFGRASARHGSARAAISQKTLVFIIGMPRSGTSLAEQILASHPEVFGGGEITFWGPAYDAFRDAEIRGEPTVDLLHRLAEGYLAQWRSLSTDAARLIDKMPVNFMYAGLINLVFPHARIIHMLRHPIDTCLSIYFQNFYNIGPYANDLDAMAHYYGEYLRIMQHWRSVLPPATMLEVPYESLVSDQEVWTRRMLDFIGAPWDPRCLEFHRTERAVITASRWQVRQKIHKRSTARWRHYENHVSPLQTLVAHRDYSSES